MLCSIGATEDAAWRRSAAAGSDGFIAGRGTSVGAVSDSLAPEAVLPLLQGRFGREYRYVDRCPSTQRLVGARDAEGTTAVADEQTEGRGRLGRRWQAPAGTSILCSILLRPAVPPERLPELTLLAARACADAIKTMTGLEPTVKEPNDVLISGRKVAGVLGEAREDHVVLGIGINVNIPASDLVERPDIPATSLLVETGKQIRRAPLLGELLVRLEWSYNAWVQSMGL
jgi:BirA family biotin operon repressor/biotin-[acetyl-CoA-carboxylase] ligase